MELSDFAANLIFGPIAGRPLVRLLLNEQLDTLRHKGVNMKLNTYVERRFPNNHEFQYILHCWAGSFIYLIRQYILNSAIGGTLFDREKGMQISHERSNKTFFKMYRFDFIENKSLYHTLQRGLVFYMILAILAIPSGICDQQHKTPAYTETLVDPNEMVSAEAALEDQLCRITLEASLAAEQAAPENEAKPEDPLAPFDDYIAQASEAYQVDPALIKAIIMAESSYNPQAVSHRGAQGLMQLMPRTAKWLGVSDTFDPALNIDGGVRYFRKLLDRFKGNVRLALAAYNAGSRYVRKYGGVPPFKATHIYIRKVLNYHKKYQQEMAADGTSPSAV